MQFGRYHKQTLCWDCACACGGCSWSDDFKPVKGWTAERRDISNKDGMPIESYIVTECPDFVRDAWDGGHMRWGR